jgi:hemerythrin superfamily protein
MNPIQMIKQDHRTVKGLFRRFEAADRHSEKQKLGQEIIEELSVHAVIEEQLLYPLLRESREEAVLNALEEHHAVKLMLAELDNMNADHERYDAKMHVVRESVEMHIEEEESKLLPRLDAMLDAEDRKMLSETMMKVKQYAPNHPHPSASDTPPLSVITAMIAKLRDSGRDVMRLITNADKAQGHRRVVRRASAKSRRQRKARGARKARGTRKARGARKTSRSRRPSRGTRARTARTRASRTRRSRARGSRSR